MISNPVRLIIHRSLKVRKHKDLCVLFSNWKLRRNDLQIFKKVINHRQISLHKPEIEIEDVMERIHSQSEHLMDALYSYVLRLE
jgi:hypothetical protein